MQGNVCSISYIKEFVLYLVSDHFSYSSRYFTGTYESTFSFRIQEEREIMGFPSDHTFNRLCGDNEKNCSEPSKWRIVF